MQNTRLEQWVRTIDQNDRLEQLCRTTIQNNKGERICRTNTQNNYVVQLSGTIGQNTRVEQKKICFYLTISFEIAIISAQLKERNKFMSNTLHYNINSKFGQIEKLKKSTPFRNVK